MNVHILYQEIKATNIYHYTELTKEGFDQIFTNDPIINICKFTIDSQQVKLTSIQIKRNDYSTFMPKALTATP